MQMKFISLPPPHQKIRVLLLGRFVAYEPLGVHGSTGVNRIVG